MGNGFRASCERGQALGKEEEGHNRERKVLRLRLCDSVDYLPLPPEVPFTSREGVPECRV